MRRIGSVTAFYSYRDFPSNHFLRSFTIRQVTFNCGEQFIMYVKAMHFGDREIAAQILQEPVPQKQKMLGRQVKPFDRADWYRKIPGWYVKGMIARYEQNPQDLKMLLATGDTLLVEASPTDDIWGVKMAEDDDNIQYPHMWRGSNLCGQGQQDAREYFKRRGVIHAADVDRVYGSGIPPY